MTITITMCTLSWPHGGGRKVFYAEATVGEAETGDLGNIPIAGKIKFSFDSANKIIRVYYDIGGDWVQLGSFDISDWLMTDTDQFCFDIYGWSMKMAIPSGKIYLDNFQTTGLTEPVSTRILQPDGVDPVFAGDPSYPVSWEAPLAATQFKLQYSLDNGTTWKPMAQGLVPGRSYDWQVPVPTNNKRKCLVKITGYDQYGAKIGTDISAPFTIEVLKLDAPNGGEEPLISETPFSITWITSPYVSSVDHIQLSYTLDNGVTWKIINTAEDPSDDGNFSWTVPRVAKDKNNCKVRTVLKSASGKTLGSDVSDGVFTIRPAPLL